jgi:purine-binding chemotaxis protein CheW
MSSDRARAIMDERARLLARPHSQAVVGETVDVLTFALAAERYAIETRYVREVVRLGDLTPVPGTPDFVAGITNHHGQVLCVMDLRSFFKAPHKGLSDLSRLVVLGVERVEFAIVADRADEIRRLSASEMLPAPESMSHIGREYLRGVTRDALMVLDGASLLEDGRLFVESA